MCIAQVAPPFESVPPARYGGTERVVSTLTEELVRLGHQVTLFAAGDSRTSARLEPTVGEALWHWEPPFKDLGPSWAMTLDAIWEHAGRFDVIHSHLDYWGFPLARHCAVPVVTTLHGRLDLPELQPLYRRSRSQEGCMILRINRFSPVHFWARVARGEGCWEWQGATRHGYGVLNRQGRAERAHRISWELTFGPIPDGLIVCRRCDNPPCRRPDHLFLGTVVDNSADMYAKGRGNTGDRNGMRRHPAAREWGNRYGALYPERRPRGEQVKSAVLTADQVRAIRARQRGGIGYRRLAREFGVHRRTIWAIVKRINWGWLEDAA